MQSICTILTVTILIAIAHVSARVITDATNNDVTIPTRSDVTVRIHELEARLSNLTSRLDQLKFNPEHKSLSRVLTVGRVANQTVVQHDAETGQCVIQVHVRDNIACARNCRVEKVHSRILLHVDSQGLKNAFLFVQNITVPRVYSLAGATGSASLRGRSVTEHKTVSATMTKATKFAVSRSTIMYEHHVKLQ